MDAGCLGVDRDDDGLSAERSRELVDQRRARERRRVDADLVGARLEQLGRVGDRAHAAADGERDRHRLGHAGRDLERRALAANGRGNVEEHELVGAAVRVCGRELDGIADVAQPAEVHALDHSPAGHVEAWDQARERHFSRNRAPAGPLFSG